MLSGADLRGALETVHFGHLAIHQDEIEGFVQDAIERDLAVVGEAVGDTERFEHGAGDCLVDRVVLGDQHPPSEPGR